MLSLLIQYMVNKFFASFILRENRQNNKQYEGILLPADVISGHGKAARGLVSPGAAGCCISLTLPLCFPAFSGAVPGIFPFRREGRL
jgi:hypothetical protein